MNFAKLSSVITLASTRTADPLAARIERFPGLEHIEPENLHIRSWGNIGGLKVIVQEWENGFTRLRLTHEKLPNIFLLSKTGGQYACT
ncbi:MAG: hypothetical protein CVU44_12890 [Chloroflexi bacterium HGW-Chloroflexi-6]|nr:MAG: hypothetical protein CVU44_12890 [Chloroflexi bacterium HGW-Chloroflexi-6]